MLNSAVRTIIKGLEIIKSVAKTIQRYRAAALMEQIKTSANKDISTLP